MLLEWSAGIAAALMIFALAGLVMVVLLRIRSILLQVSGILNDLHTELTETTREAKRLLQHTSQTVTSVNRHLSALDGILQGIEESGQKLSQSGKRAAGIVQSITLTAADQLEDAHRRYEARYADVLALLGAGSAVWQSWSSLFRRPGEPTSSKRRDEE